MDKQIVDCFQHTISIWTNSKATIIQDTPTNTEIASIQVAAGQWIVVFNHTDSDIDWDQNNNYKLTNVKLGQYNMKIHRGYWHKLLAICDRLIFLLVSAKEVVLTGYSQGGGMAQIAAVLIRLLIPAANVKCYAFASSRVGDRAFARTHDRLVHYSMRVYYGHDPVPALLPAVLGYCHTQQAIWLEAEGQVICHDRPAWLNWKILFQFAARSVFKLDVNPYIDHNRQLMSHALFYNQQV